MIIKLKKIYIYCYFFVNNFVLYAFNTFINRIPLHLIRLYFYKLVMSVGKQSTILMYVNILSLNKIQIGSNTVINQCVILDGRGGDLVIGNNVDIAPNVSIYTTDHDPDSDYHSPRNNPVIIEDNVWIASNSIILPGVIIRMGSVIAAGSVVTKSTDPFSIYAGNPAKFIRNRKSKILYKNSYRPWFM